MIERRQHKRYLTLRNARIAFIAVVVAFAAITIQSSLRGKKSGEYGRLFGEQVQTAPIDVRKVEPVVEAPAVADHTAADPMLLAPAAREQLLGTPATTSAAVVTPEPPPFFAQPRPAGEGSHVAIVGGAEGVSIVATEQQQQQPALSGGIFKQH